jgi:endonuclease-3
MLKKNFEKILELLEKKYPNAKTALNFSTTFQLLIATMLSAQSTDKQVNKVTEKIFKKYSEPEHFSKLMPDKLAEEIKGVGLYNNKSKNIIETSKIIENCYAGKTPNDFDSLLSLPGVGRKTANVVLSNAFGKDAIAVDTHVHRVSNRLGLADSKNPEATEQQLKKCIPKEKWSAAHHWLILHGREICKAQRPNCEICFLSHLCKYFSLK